MRAIVMAAVALGAICTTSDARAEFKSGNQLLSECTAQRGTAGYYQDMSSCFGYITATYDTEEFYEQFEGVPDYVCLPQGVTVGQMADVVIAYLRRSPEVRHKAASSLVLVALGIAFPCGQAK